jgi:NAD(P)-dependent dehydrogenase (short-subunit alcohol dehydrogenase family)
MPKTIVITGTATGMGRATVNKFAVEGWNIVATVRKESDLKAHAGLCYVKTVLLDVDDETATVPFARLTLEQFDGVDALVNNAIEAQNRRRNRAPGRGRGPVRDAVN